MSTSEHVCEFPIWRKLGWESRYEYEQYRAKDPTAPSGICQNTATEHISCSVGMGGGCPASHYVCLRHAEFGSGWDALASELHQIDHDDDCDGVGCGWEGFFEHSKFVRG